jgi:hypothetical protein
MCHAGGVAGTGRVTNISRALQTHLVEEANSARMCGRVLRARECVHPPQRAQRQQHFTAPQVNLMIDEKTISSSFSPCATINTVIRDIGL